MARYSTAYTFTPSHKLITKTFKKKKDAIEFARQVEGNRKTQYLLSNSVLSTPLSQLIHEFVPPGKDPCIAGRVAWWNEQIGHLHLLMYKYHNSK